VLIPTTTWFTAACLSVVQGLFLRTLNLSRQVLAYGITLMVTKLIAAGIASAWFGTATSVAVALTIQTVAVGVFFLFYWPPWRAQRAENADETANPQTPEILVEDPLSPAELPIVVEIPHDDRARAPLSVTALRDGVAGPTGPWRRLDVVDETGSTNADQLARARAGEDIDGAVLIAEHQTAGRGRLGRRWVTTPRSQLALSVGVDAAGVPTDRWGLLPLVTGLAVVDAIAREAEVRADLKWPNDVLVDGAKLAGILAEVASPGQAIVVGIGLNVTLGRSESGEPNAVSLRDLGVTGLDRDRLARGLLLALAERITQWRTGADDRLTADYRERSATIGAQVRVSLPGGNEVVGTALAVDEQGRLVVDSAGKREAVSAGDVVHLRPLGSPDR
jgi:BirA family biotin operon repressor/biotin-[acetyl-CoA-carboxylase] ligase